jgi:hypothetical protein
MPASRALTSWSENGLGGDLIDQFQRLRLPAGVLDLHPRRASPGS